MRLLFFVLALSVLSTSPPLTALGTYSISASVSTPDAAVARNATAPALVLPASDASTPDESAPDASTPDESNPDESAPAVVLFFGDSIAAGYGLDQQQAFPAQVGLIADSLGFAIEVINAGLSGETSAGGLRRVDWVLQRPIDVFVLELGGNDALRGVDPEHTMQNLQGIMDRVRERQPDARILLTGMLAPPNMGADYSLRFAQLFQDLARENNVAFMPFILEGVAGEPDLNLPDGIHPTAKGHRIIARELWPYLKPLL